MARALDAELKLLETVVEQKLQLLLTRVSVLPEGDSPTTISNVRRVDSGELESLQSMLSGVSQSKVIPGTRRSNVRNVNVEELGFIKKLLLRFSAFFRKS